MAAASRLSLVAVACAFLAVGCDNGGNDGYVPLGSAYPPDTGSGIIESIDTNQHLDVDPGKGAGLFVEYDAGGHWHIFTACDTLVSKSGCTWDVIASVDSTMQLSVVDQSDLEPDDTVYRVDNGSVRLVFDTTTDEDGVRLDAPPGQELGLDILLDGYPDGSLVSWVSKQTVQTGTVNDPFFAPTSP